MTAQFLYDLRTLTGFVSGQDLQNLFHALGLGYRPKGRVEIDVQQAGRLCPEFEAEMHSQEWGAHARSYCGLYGGNTHLFMYQPSEAEELVSRLVGEAEDFAYAGAGV